MLCNSVDINKNSVGVKQTNENKVGSLANITQRNIDLVNEKMFKVISDLETILGVKFTKEGNSKHFDYYSANGRGHFIRIGGYASSEMRYVLILNNRTHRLVHQGLANKNGEYYKKLMDDDVKRSPAK